MKTQSLLAAAMCALLAACAHGGPSGGAAQGEAAQVALYAMDCGAILVRDAAPFADDGSFAGVRRLFVNPCYLIRTAKGDLLWDSGLPTSVAAQPQTERGVFVLSLQKTLTAQLAEIGLTPEDVEFFSISHSHFDHLGNGSLFAGATFLVDPKERAFMFRDEIRGRPQDFAAYSALETATTVELAPDAAHDVFGDGAVLIHPAPGHTPGHRVLQVNLESGTVLLAGDMWHMIESRQRRTVPTFNTDRAQTLASMDAVEALAARTDARVLRQHVPEDFDALPKFPQPLR